MIEWKNLQKLLSEPGRKTKLSKATGISTGNISDWFNPDKSAQPSADALYKIAEYLECSVDYLMDRTNTRKLHKQLPDNIIHLIDMGEIMFIETYMEKVSAGRGNTIISCDKIPKLYPATTISSKASYAAIITGDSMEPQFTDNDIIYVDANQIPVHGEIGVFTYNGEAYCKEYYALDGVEKLISLNDIYDPIIIDNNLQFEKQGVVIGKFHAD